MYTYCTADVRTSLSRDDYTTPNDNAFSTVVIVAFPSILFAQDCVHVGVCEWIVSETSRFTIKQREIKMKK